MQRAQRDRTRRSAAGCHSSNQAVRHKEDSAGTRALYGVRRGVGNETRRGLGEQTDADLERGMVISTYIARRTGRQLSILWVRPSHQLNTGGRVLS